MMGLAGMCWLLDQTHTTGLVPVARVSVQAERLLEFEIVVLQLVLGDEVSRLVSGSGTKFFGGGALSGC